MNRASNERVNWSANEEDDNLRFVMRLRYFVEESRNCPVSSIGRVFSSDGKGNGKRMSSCRKLKKEVATFSDPKIELWVPHLAIANLVCCSENLLLLQVCSTPATDARCVKGTFAFGSLACLCLFVFLSALHVAAISCTVKYTLVTLPASAPFHRSEDDSYSKVITHLRRQNHFRYQHCNIC